MKREERVSGLTSLGTCNEARNERYHNCAVVWVLVLFSFVLLLFLVFGWRGLNE